MMQHFGVDPFILEETSEISIDNLLNIICRDIQNFSENYLNFACLTSGLSDKWDVTCYVHVRSALLTAISQKVIVIL